VEKFATNVECDRRNLGKLQDAGWRTAVVWECWLREKEIPGLIDALSHWIESGAEFALPMNRKS
jgi:DNA mismatch endonuclease (patch repair protein)